MSNPIHPEAMCMRTKMRAPLRAGRDIYCYKVLILDKPTEHIRRFLSPVIFHEYLPDRKMRLAADKEFRMENYKPEDEWMSISYGFHSFMRQPEVRRDQWEKYRYVVAKCRIPRGSWYWKGNRGGWGQEEYDEYCSDCIELVAWLDPYSWEWRRPKRDVRDWPESSKVSILKGLDVTEAARMLGRWYVCESSHLSHDYGTYLFYRAGHGYVELHTYCNKVTGVV